MPIFRLKKPREHLDIQTRPLPPVPNDTLKKAEQLSVKIQKSESSRVGLCLPPPSPTSLKRRGVPMMGTLAMKLQQNQSQITNASQSQLNITAPVVRSSQNQSKDEPRSRFQNRTNINRFSALPLIKPDFPAIISANCDPGCHDEKIEAYAYTRVNKSLDISMTKTEETTFTWPPFRAACNNILKKRRDCSSSNTTVISIAKKRFSDTPLCKKMKKTSLKNSDESHKTTLESLTKFKLMKICQQNWSIKSRPDGSRYLVRKRPSNRRSMESKTYQCGIELDNSSKSPEKKHTKPNSERYDPLETETTINMNTNKSQSLVHVSAPTSRQQKENKQHDKSNSTPHLVTMLVV